MLKDDGKATSSKKNLQHSKRSKHTYKSFKKTINLCKFLGKFTDIISHLRGFEISLIAITEVNLWQPPMLRPNSLLFIFEKWECNYKVREHASTHVFPTQPNCGEFNFKFGGRLAAIYGYTNSWNLICRCFGSYSY